MNFGEIINRRNSCARKWDGMEEVFGVDDLLPLWIADMDFAAPPAVIDAVKKSAEHGVYGYPVRTPAYFEAIINWFARRHDFFIDKEWMVCTPAVVTAISVAIQTFSDPGDDIIIQPPIYPPFFSCALKNNRNIIENPLVYKNGEYELDIEDFERKLTKKTKMFILCNPHNPVGRVWRKDELLRIGKICVERNITVLADEMHCDLAFRGYKHIAFATLSPEIAKQTITMVSPAKTFNLAGFYNSTTIISNPQLRRPFYNALDRLELLSGNLFGVVSSEAAYNQGEEWLDELLIYLEDNANYLVKYTKENMPKLRVVIPEATYLAWIDCNDLNLSADELKEFFITMAKVGINNGATFGRQGQGFIRLNFGCPRATLHEGLEKIKNALLRY